MDIESLIQHDVALSSRTSLRVGGSAEYFLPARSQDVIIAGFKWAKTRNLPVTVLGGGTNVVVSDAGVQGLVITPQLTQVTYDESESLRAHVEAGVILDAFVIDTVQKGFWGVENFSSIPGTVGAVPVQNVGAYGLEAHDCVASVTAIHIDTGEVCTFTPQACGFGYRHSFFKTDGGKRYIITSVEFRLSRIPDRRISYPDLRAYFGNNAEPTLMQIREAIRSIRGQKFPDWTKVGTAGSFFKNCIVDDATHTRLSLKYPNLPQYAHAEGLWKISLGWILDHVCGLRGFEMNGVALYEKQALVLVTKNNSVTANDIEMFAREIQKKVFEKINVMIECEVTFLK